jgi:hypothetical protein
VDTVTDERIAWFHAQIDHDERIAQACSGDGEWTASDIAIYGPDLGPEVRTHMALHDPARELREVEFKRRILNFLEETRSWAQDNSQWSYDDTEAFQALAAPYADRPGYHEMWGQRS